ncbi:MAG: YidC/Oxa1 family membrane protein insertase [SAR202 cluster bacterium]|nr:YidC/Oxa1 family membrane protein insertase [SAR202 cluster bacterium]
MGFIGDIWVAAIERPMINALVLLYHVFFNNFGLSIIVFTVIIRVIMFPLTVKQANFTKKMAALQPKMQEINTKYAKDPQKKSQETMKLYREAGFNPLGCLGPVLIQFPIWIGLYRAIIETLPTTPDKLADLSQNLYSWAAPIVQEVIPLSGSFLGADLAKRSQEYPLPASLILPVLVGISMYFMQKMTMTPSASPSQESTNRMMLWMLPVMFGFFTLQFSSGLALYWIVSNIIGIIIQGFITGWEPLTGLFRKKVPKPATAPALTVSNQEVIAPNEDNRDNSEDSRRSDRTGTKGAKRRPRGSRNRRR